MTGIPQGSEFAINTVTAGSQQTFFAFSGQTSHTPRAVAIDSNGDYIVTWTGRDDSSGGIYARRYNKDGVAQDTSEFQVNTTTVNNQSFSSVAMDADGDFVITWSSFQDDGSGLTSYDIYAQRYDKTGLAQGSEFLVNAPSLADQTESTVAMSADGSFVITWTGTDTNGKGVFAQRYDSTGLAQGSEFRVNTETVGAQQSSSAGMDADGDFVVTWTSTGQDGSSDGIYAQRYNKDGIAQGTEFLVNTTTAARQQNASVSMDAVGNFVVAWSSENQDGSGFGVYAQVFDAAGNRVGSEIQVNQFTASDQRSPSVSVDADGDFVITWSSNNQPTDSASTGIFSRRFNKIGIPQGSEFLVNTTVAGTQQYPAVAVDADGDFVIAWTSPDASGVGVYGQRFAPNPNNSPISLSLTSLAVIENIATPTTVGLFTTVDPDPGTSFIYTLVDETGSFPDNNSFEIGGPNNDQLILLFSPDRELKPNFTIRVRTTQTTDPDGFFYEKTLTINVIDVSDTAPSDIALTSSILAEDVAIGTVVGIVSTTDPDISDTSFTYTLVNDPVNFPDNTAFSIDPTTGQLKVVAALDFDIKPIYSIRVRTTDPTNRSYEETLNLTVTNVNEAPTALELTPKAVDENVPIGTVVGLFSTTDPDVGDTFTYTLVDDPINFPDNAAFTIDPLTKALKVNTAIDFETKPTYTLQVRTTDAAGLFFEDALTITVNDLLETPGNQAPTALELTPKAVDENVPIGTVVGLFSTTDPDVGDTFTYTLVDDPTNFPDNAAFTIDPLTKALKVNTAIDFETKPTYTLQVRTTDAAGLFFEDALTITVNDLLETPGNQAPTALELTPKAVDENVPIGTVVGLFSTTDPDVGDTFTYTLVDDPINFPDNAAFTIDPLTKALKVNTAIDFETKPTYTLQVRTTDAAGLFFEDALTITVNDLLETPGNQAPTALELTPKAVDENVPIGTVVGLFSTTDPDVGDTFTYTLVDDPINFPDNAAFTIDPLTKALKVNTVIDFETKPTYTLQVRTTDAAGLFFEDALTITVNDLLETPGNQAPTALELTPKAVDENVAIGTVVGLFSTTDPDVGDTFTYTLVDDPINFPDNAAFTIDPLTKALKVNTAIDFETKPTYTLQVRTTDAAGLFFEDALTITVNDLLETPGNQAPTALELTPKAVDENVPIGTVVGLFSTTDPDVGDTFTYTLVDDPTNFPDNAAFTIDPLTKALKVNTAIDFETKPTYTLQVRTTDAAGLFFEDALTITVNDLLETPGNQAPTALELTPKAVDENVAIGTVVGLFSTTDPDVGDTFTYTLVDDPINFPDNAAFTIDPLTKALKVNTAIDFETKPTYTLQVRTTDAAGLFFEDALTITVNDLLETPGNQAPTALELTPKAVDENVAIGTVVGLFSTTDPDVGDTFTYTLVDDPINFPDNAAFTIDPLTKALKVNTAIDFETKPTYTLQVRTTDAAGLFFEDALTITVNDLLETPGNQAPTALELTPKAVDENVAIGTVVGLFSTTDPDVGDTFTYTLVDDPINFPDNAAFTIDPLTKALKVNTAIDFETKPTYTLQVRTTDAAGLFFEDALTITVNDLLETPGNQAPTALELTPKAVDENVPIGTVVGLFSTTDPDVGDTFTYTLVDDPINFPDNAAFTIDPLTKALKVNTVIDFETKPTYTLQVRTTDAAGLFFEDALTITVNDLLETPGNQAPTALELTPKAVDENVAIGTVVGLFSTTDPDVGDTFTYTLVDDPINFPDNAAFTIDPLTKALKVNTAIDFETKPTYTLQVRTTDAAGLFFEDALTITVNDLLETPGNQAPTALELTPKAVDENVPIGTVVGLFSTTDPDVGDTFTYTLVDDPINFPDNAAFTIDPLTKALKVNTVIDFETKPTYTLQVRTTDAAGLFFEDALTITVNDLLETPGNQAPTALELTPKAVDENVAIGTVVGLFSTTDPDVGDTFTYTLVDDPINFPDNAAFTINPLTKALKVNTAIDFETKPTYTLQVRTTDAAGLFFEDALTITVNDLLETPGNQAPTALELTPKAVDENVAIGTVVGLFSTTDPDVGDTFTYTLVDDPINFPDNAAFTIDPLTKALKVNTAIDFETKPTYTLQVRTTDAAGLFFEDALTITVNDLLETPGNQAPTALELTPKAVDENVAIGTVVGLFSTTDPDVGDTFTYTLVDDPINFPDNAAFTIDPLTKALKVNTVIDFETKPTYTLQVRTTDAAGLFFEDALTITVNDLLETPGNQAPTALELTPKAVDENVAIGTVVGLFSTTDPDVGDTFTYTLVDDPINFPDNAAFTIDPLTKALKVNTAIDFETKPTYTLQVRTTDAAGLFFEDALTITVNDLLETPGNQAPTALELTPKAVDENVAIGTVVGLFSTTDPDVGDTFTYTLVDDPINFPDNAAFTIDPLTKALKVNTAIDFETKPTYTLQVRTTDAAGLFFEDALTITVNDLLETPGNQAPTALELTPKAVDENVAIGTVVGLFSTTDPDVGDTFTYTLVDDPINFPDNAAFTIDPLTKALKVNTVIDFETKPTYTLQVRTTDAAGLFFEDALTITVNDLLETPGNQAPTALELTPKAVDENVAIGTVVGLFSTTDPDVGDTFTYTLVDDPINFPDNAVFTIDPLTKALKVNTAIDFETKPTYTLQVRTTDAAGLFFEDALTITVNDLLETPGNQAPTALELTPKAVDENVPIGTVVGLFSTTDPDVGDTFTYTLVDDPINFPDNAAFTIDPLTKALKVNTAIDFETKPTYTLQVRTTDAAGLFFEDALTITVNDLLETPGNQAPTALELTPKAVDENVAIGTVVGLFSTTDPDVGDTFTYTLVDDPTNFPDNAAFTIDGGQLRIAVSPDFEAKSSYSIQVRTTDQSGEFFEDTLAITILDVNEPIPGSEVPVLDLNGAAAGVNGGTAGASGNLIQLVSTDATLTDTDSPNLNSALVIVSNSFDTPNETLTANTSGTGINATYSPVGVLSLTGTASIATYLQVLRSVTYLNSAAIPNTTPRNVLFIVSDGQNNAQATTTLTLDSVNSITGTAGNDTSLVTTPIADVIDAIAGNDVVTSIADYLKQQDSINGGDGVDTLVLRDGTGNLTVRVADTTNQLPDLAVGTTISNFEAFDLSGFTGNVNMLGSAALNDNLTSGTGNDTLNGAAGADTMVGNQGDDLYVVDSASDRVIEALNGGTDTVQTAINYTLSANVENLILTNNAANGTGNSLDNLIIGNARANQLKGGAGNDSLLGGGKSDILVGGAGDDRLNGQSGEDKLKGGQGKDSFVLSAARGFGSDVIADFKPTDDTILFSRSGVGSSINLGAISAAQLVYGSTARDAGDRFVYNLQTGALLFDRDGIGSAQAVLIGTLKNKPTITASDIVVI